MKNSNRLPRLVGTPGRRRRDNDDVEYRGRSVIALAAVKHEVRAPFAMKESEEQRGKSAFSLRRKTPISGWREGS